MSVKNISKIKVVWFGISNSKFVFGENTEDKKMFKPLNIIMESEIMLK